jgi:hypothetical protein
MVRIKRQQRLIHDRAGGDHHAGRPPSIEDTLDEGEKAAHGLTPFDRLRQRDALPLMLR